MIDKILLAVDGSQNAMRATEMAARLAAKLNLDLFIVHVLMHGRPPQELMHMAEIEHLVKEAHTAVSPEITYVTGSHFELLGRAATDPRYARIITILGEQIAARAKTYCADQGVKNIKTSVRAGDYAEGILNAAKEYDVGMTVIGSRGLGILKGTVLGSVSQKVLHHAERSVLVVK